MTLAEPVDIVVNPNNTAQRYVLYGNGRVEEFGGAAPITSGPAWYDRPDQPVAVALHISNWTNGQGQILDFQGGFQPLNGAPDYMNTSGDWPVNTLGLVYDYKRRYMGWSWNTSGAANGYVMDLYGQLFPFGGAPVPTRGGPRFTTPAVRGFAMQWTPDKRAYTLDQNGAVWPDFAAVAPNPGPAYFKNQDVARDVAVTDWTLGKGYALHGDGATHPFGGAASPGTAGPYRAGADLARALVVLSTGDPLRFLQVHSTGATTGGLIEYVSSTPPTVTAGGTTPESPATTTTDTTRPILAWDYSDPQRDSQAAWQLLVFSQAFATANSMSDPLKWAASALVNESGTNPSLRGIESPVDLANGAYRMYVRVQDTAGQWSPWANRGWTQAVPLPVTPTGLTATITTPAPALPASRTATGPPAAAYRVALSVSATTGGSANLIRFECSDDGGLTWTPVRGAEAVPLTATTTAFDYDIPLSVTRTYRARSFSRNPRVLSDPSNTQTTQVAARTYVLTSTANPALGGQVMVQEPVEWTRPITSGVFQGLGAKYPTVLSDGEPKARRLPLNVVTRNRGDWARLSALLESDSTLVFRDPFGEVIYCRPTGDWSRALLKSGAFFPDDEGEIAHMHTTSVSLVEVKPPIEED